MAVDQSKIALVSGRNGEVFKLPPYPIVAQRDPSTRDQAQLGCTWINEVAKTAWMLVSNENGVNTWTTSPASGLGDFTSIEVDPGDVDIIAGDLNLTAGNIDVAVGNVSIGGDLTVSGTTILAGDVEITSNIVSMIPATDTEASPTAAVTIDQRVFKATFTGFATAAAASQAFTITNSEFVAGSGVFVTVSNAGSNDAKMTLTRVNVETTGTLIINTVNNGAAALNGDVVITGWIID